MRVRLFVGMVVSGIAHLGEAARQLESVADASGKPVGFQFHVQDPVAQHDHPAGVPLLSGGGKVKQEAAPHPELTPVIAPEPEAAQVDGIVQQHHVHGVAIASGGLKDGVLDGLGTPPVPDGKAGGK